MTKRVVVTGVGLVAPLGCDVKVVWNGLISSRSAIRTIDHFNVQDMPSKVAGVVAGTEDLTLGFDPDRFVPPKEQKKMDRFILFGIAAAQNAIEDAGWTPTDEESLCRTGVVIGSGIGGLPEIEKSSILVHEKGVRRLGPFFIPASLINLVSGHVSMRYGFAGPNSAVSTACSSGAHAICDAVSFVKNDYADVVVAGGAESAICRVGLAGFSAARALSTNFNDRPTEASRPWDKERDGFVMGEGAGVIVIEELEHAKKRGAYIYGEIIGCGMSGDAYHITAPHPDGRGATRSMLSALRNANIDASQVDYINAHGTSTPMGDEIELAAVKKVFGEHAYKLSMSSTKSAIGHLLGAAGSVEAIFSLLTIKGNVVPPTLNLHNPSEGCDIDLVPLVAKERKVEVVMSNSFGFGGTNATLLMRRFVG